MRIAVLATVLLTAAVVPVLAQPCAWETVSMVPGIMCSDMCLLRDGRHGWFVGSTGSGGEVRSAIFSTTDGGNHWLELPFPETTSASPNGVFFVTADTGWIVGAGGYIRRTTDGGMTWQTQSAGTSRKLNRVHFVGSRTGWITGGWQDGSSYPLFKTTNSGESWQDLSFGSDCYSCEDIWFADSLNGWIVGQNSSINPFIQHTTNGGTSWNPQSPPLPSGNGPASSVCFPTPLIGWASVSSIYQSPAGTILHTTDGGSTWQAQGATNLHYNYALDAPDTLHAAILSTQVLGTGQGKVFWTTDGGRTWSNHGLPTYSYGSGCQYRGSDIWVGQEYSQVYHSADNGSTFDWQHYAPLWRSVAWSSADNGWLVTGSNAGIGFCLRSFDGGATWVRDPDAPGGTQVQFLDANRGWMLMEGNNASVYRTTDGGLNWARFSTGTGNWVARLCFATPDSGWACGANGTMLMTTNGGVTWTPQALGVSAYVDFVEMVSSQEGWAAGGYGSGSGFIRHTTNAGQNWLAQQPAQADHFACASFTDAMHGWMGAYNGRVHATTDGGQNWQIVGSVPHFYVTDIAFADADNGWLTAYNASSSQPGEDGRGFIYETTNGGITWTQVFQSPWPRNAIMDVAARPGGDWWACGQNATLLKSPPPGGVEEGSTPSAVRLALQAEPSPFRTTVRVCFRLPKAGPVTLTVYNAAGQRVRTLFDGRMAAGQHRVAWEGGGAPRGIYFCRVRAAGCERSVKLCRQ